MANNNILKKSIAFLLLVSMNLNTFAANVVLDPNANQNTSLDTSANGVPIINIATPNNRGISMNEFLQYNVGNEGQVLNNADNVGRSHLAGLINSNPNLGPHQAAGLIILQVNGANRSDIEGYIEALSREKVNVILSNENGININGGGTINIKNFTPTTGKVVLNNGDYVGIDVNRGHVVIGSNGFDASTTDYVDLISKTLELQGNLVGNDVRTVQGSNYVDKDGNITANSSGTPAAVAIDGSQLGGMYANRIKIIATDKGAGVNNNAFVVSKNSKLEITADGKIHVNKVQGQGIEITGSSYEQKDMAYSDKGITVNAGAIKLDGTGTQAVEDINLNGNVTNSTVVYTTGSLNTKNLTSSGDIQATNRVNVAGNLDNSGKIQTSGKVDVSGNGTNSGLVQTVDKITIGGNVTNSGDILTNEDFKAKNTTSSGNINAKNITIGNLTNTGKVQSTGNLSSGNIDNTGDILVSGKIQGQNLKNDGKVLANETIDVKDVKNTKTIQAVKSISAEKVDNTGEISTNEDFTAKNTTSSGTINARNLTVGELKNDGKIQTSGNLSSKNIDNTGDVLVSGKIQGQNLKNHGKVLANETIDVKDVKNTKTIQAVKSISAEKIDNTGEISTNENLTAKNTTSSGVINAKNVTIANLDNKGKVHVDKNLKTDNISNDGDVLVGGKIDGKNIDNKGKVLANETVSVSDVTNTGKIIAGKNITTGKVKNDGTLASNEDIKINGSLDNTKDIEGKNVDVNGSHLNNKGKIVTDNLKVTATNVDNSGKILSVNNSEFNTNKLDNSGEILAGNNIKADNTNLNNSGKIASNNSISIKNSAINNSATGEILSDKIDMSNATSFSNTGKISGGETKLTTSGNLNLVGSLHGQRKLEIEANNIENNGQTTSTGLISIKSNDFKNNKELSSDTILIDAKGNVENNDMITGNQAQIKAKNIVNNDLIATENALILEAQNQITNTTGSTIYGGKVQVTATDVFNEKNAEILGGDLIRFDVTNLKNNVGTIQSSKDIIINANKVENIGEVTGFGNYERYYVTPDGKELTEAEVNSKWIFKTSDGDNVSKPKTKHKRWKNFKVKFVERAIKDELNKSGKMESELLKKYGNEIKKEVDNGSDKYKYFKSSDAKYKLELLDGKIKSNSTTEYGKILASDNITINANEVKNKDSIISAGEKLKIDANRIENFVSIDENNPLADMDGYEEIKLRRSGSIKWKLRANYTRDLEKIGITYEAGQPSVLEGKIVDIDSSKIVTQPIPESQGLKLENSSKYGVTGSLFNQTIGKGISQLNNNILVASSNQNAQIINNTPNIQIVNNMSGVQNIINTGVISVNPVMTSAMFTQNVNPTSNYLMETRSKYISLSQYYGSDYFLSRIGYSPSWNRVRRLGDAYYENQLLTRSLTEQLGTAFINGKSNQDLIKSLMDNAGTESARLGLQLGEELTQDQISNLSKDLIWYVTKEVNGIQVLVPQIYLTKETRSTFSVDGRNRIGGTELTYIESENLVNNGTKIGNGGTTIVDVNSLKNETTTNQLSEITGDRTYVFANENIENIGGAIRGENIVALISDNGNVINDTTKRTVGYNNGEYDRSQYEKITSVGEISSNGTTYIKANEYQSLGGILKTDDLQWEVNKINANAIELSGEDKHGINSNNFSRYSENTHSGALILANSTSGTVGDINLVGSDFLGGDTTGLLVKGNIKAESVVNSYEEENKTSDKGFLSSQSKHTNLHQEENVASNLQLGENAIILGNVNAIGSNIYLGDGTYVGGKVTTDSRELHNSYYEENRKSGLTGGISGGTISVGYGKSKNTYDEKSTVNAKSNLYIGDNSVLNNGAEITATNFVHGDISINNGDVKYGARIDTSDVKTTSKSSNIGISVSVNSPIVDRVNQLVKAGEDIKHGNNRAGAIVNVGNSVAASVYGLAGNQGVQSQMSYLNDPNAPKTKEQEKAEQKSRDDARANNGFYLGISANVGYNRSESSSNAHNESAVVTTITGIDQNSKITYNNVGSITYQGTKASDTTFVYNNVKDVVKEAVELHNSYSSSGSSFGVGVGANMILSPDLNKGVLSNDKFKANDISASVNISASRNGSNTNETNYHNGDFQNVNEVYNNVENLTINGFNQVGGKVTGNIQNFEIGSLQNTSVTDGYSVGGSIGIPIGSGKPSVNVNASQTDGSGRFVENQTSFIVGEGSNLTIQNTKNTGAIIGTEAGVNAVIDIKNYEGKDLENSKYMTTTGISAGTSGMGGSYANDEKEGITRNTVIGNVTIANATGDEINKDITKANEITHQDSTNVDVYAEDSLIRAIQNFDEFKQKQKLAIQEIKDITGVIVDTINNKGADERGFVQMLNERRRATTMNNLVGNDLKMLETNFKIGVIKEEQFQNGLKIVVENFLKDTGIDVDLIYSDSKNMPKDSKNSEGTARIEDGKIKIYINTKAIESTSQLIGTVFEEVAHVLDGVAGRQQETTEEEKEYGEYGLESLGKPTGKYFEDMYKENDRPITLSGDGIDYSDVEGEKLGDRVKTTIVIVAGGAGKLIFAGKDDIYGKAIGDNGEIRYFHSKVYKGGIGVGIEGSITAGKGIVEGTNDPDDLKGWGGSFGMDVTLPFVSGGFSGDFSKSTGGISGTLGLGGGYSANVLAGIGHTKVYKTLDEMIGDALISKVTDIIIKKIKTELKK